MNPFSQSCPFLPLSQSAALEDYLKSNPEVPDTKMYPPFFSPSTEVGSHSSALPYANVEQVATEGPFTPFFKTLENHSPLPCGRQVCSPADPHATASDRLMYKTPTKKKAKKVDYRKSAKEEEQENHAGHRKPQASRVRRFKCTNYPECDKAFDHVEHLCRHERAHTKEKPFRCHCNKLFSRVDNWREHHRQAHVGEMYDAAFVETESQLVQLNRNLTAIVAMRYPTGSASTPQDALAIHMAGSSSRIPDAPAQPASLCAGLMQNTSAFCNPPVVASHQPIPCVASPCTPACTRANPPLGSTSNAIPTPVDSAFCTTEFEMHSHFDEFRSFEKPPFLVSPSKYSTYDSAPTQLSDGPNPCFSTRRLPSGGSNGYTSVFDAGFLSPFGTYTDQESTSGTIPIAQEKAFSCHKLMQAFSSPNWYGSPPLTALQPSRKSNLCATSRPFHGDSQSSLAHTYGRPSEAYQATPPAPLPIMSIPPSILTSRNPSPPAWQSGLCNLSPEVALMDGSEIDTSVSALPLEFLPFDLQLLRREELALGATENGMGPPPVSVDGTINPARIQKRGLEAILDSINYHDDFLHKRVVR